MRLRAWKLSMERGGRRLFSNLGFEAEAGSALIVTGPNGAGKSSLLRGLCGFLPFQSGGFALDGGDDERTVGEQAHYLGHADALKGALTARREPRLLGRDARRRFAREKPAARRSDGSASPMSSTFPRAPSRPVRSGGSRSRGCWSPGGRCGCSTSRRPPSTSPLKPPSPRSCRGSWTRAGSSSPRPTRRWGS